MKAKNDRKKTLGRIAMIFQNDRLGFTLRHHKPRAKEY